MTALACALVVYRERRIQRRRSTSTADVDARELLTTFQLTMAVMSSSRRPLVISVCTLSLTTLLCVAQLAN